MTVWKAIKISLIFIFLGSFIYSLLDTLKFFWDLNNFQYSFYKIINNIIAQICSFLITKRIFFSSEKIILKKVSTNSFILIVFVLFVLGDVSFQYGFNNILDIILKTNTMGNVNGGNIPLSYFILRLIKGCLVAPLVEELFFRKFIQENLAKCYSNTFALISSSILFTLYHTDLNSSVQIFILGIILGIIFIKTQRIEYSILFHSILNFVIYIVNYSYQEQSLQSSSSNFMYVTVGLLTIILGVWILKRKKFI
ncbi:CPBP family intramembrane glutamic endopeptidase [Chryseobacterium culicis]|uniref:CPBP family intramembrane glutamic endopeptidase n=1 Tax=Chryseobacterium culicis TaxID=680127 RepID=UPI001875AC15|nr:CPBP family intramembrane glutamic endopeptidase [Chryseobacterium culicis]MBE4947603.1 CPBP family intramembrane metalloprotease [Chryseobacterium culicis]